MKTPSGILEVYLQPGDFYFGDSSTRIRTVLGSCVSITMWHPTRLVGGMCHYMLPGRRNRTGTLQGKYADEAIEMFLNAAKQHKTKPQDYQVKLFGGGAMFSERITGKNVSVSVKNIEAGRRLLAENNLSLTAQHVGLSGHRIVVFDIASGFAWVKHQPMMNE